MTTQDATPKNADQKEALELPKPPKLIVTDPSGNETVKKEKKQKSSAASGGPIDEKTKLEENWKYIHEKEKGRCMIVN